VSTSSQFSFRERLSGPVALGVTTPRLGAHRGRVLDTRLVAELEVTVDDLGAELTGDGQAARLGGTIRLPGLTSGTAITDGTARLYATDAEVGMKLIRYDARFVGDDGVAYRLRATKFIRPGRGTIREHLTAYTRIVEATPVLDRDGASPTTASSPRTELVVAAGILKGGIRDLAALLWSVRAAGSSRLAAVSRLVALARRGASTATPILAT